MTDTLLDSTLSTDEIEQRFDAGKDVFDAFDVDHPVIEHAPACDDSQRRANTILPAWPVDFMDDEASMRH